MTAPVLPSQPICATPPDDLSLLAEAIETARLAYLDAHLMGNPELLSQRTAELKRVLWNDKGTFGPALRQAAIAASLKTRIQELTTLVEGGLAAINAARHEEQASMNGHDVTADKYAKIVMDWQRSARAALSPKPAGETE